MGLKTENFIKGKIADVLAEQLLKDLGFFVLPFGELGFFLLNSGKEHAVEPIVDMKSFIKTCGGKFEFDKLSNDSISARKILGRSPDLIAVHPSGRMEFIKAKYSFNGQLRNNGKRFFKLYPNVVLLVINLEITQNSIESKTPTERPFDADLQKTRFHIWRHDELKVGTVLDSVTVVSLSQWLIEEFKFDTVQVERLVKEYESYVTQWFSKAAK